VEGWGKEGREKCQRVLVIAIPVDNIIITVIIAAPAIMAITGIDTIICTILTVLITINVIAVIIITVIAIIVITMTKAIADSTTVTVILLWISNT
jgi:hypothetical protein